MFVLLSNCFAGSVFCFVSVLCVCLSVCVMSVCGECACVDDFDFDFVTCFVS